MQGDIYFEDYLNLGLDLICLESVTLEELKAIYCSWQQNGFDSLLNTYGEFLLNNDIDGILKIDKEFLKENRGRG